VLFEENEILGNPVQVGVWQEQAPKHRYTSTVRLLRTFFCNGQEMLSSHAYDIVRQTKINPDAYNFQHGNYSSLYFFLTKETAASECRANKSALKPR
jgi:hypothetical protein